MLVRILHFFRGYVSLLLHGHFIERFINICTRRNIYMWDISKHQPTSASMKMSIRGFRQLRPIAKKTHTKVHIKKKHGFPIIMHRYRKRYFFFGGIALVALFIAIMSQFIWSIDIVGNERVPSEQIMTTLNALGLREGTFRGSLDVTSLKDNILLNQNSLSWAWVEIKGCKVVVNVLEKKLVTDVVAADTPCDIVAAKPGIIKVVNAKTGQSVVLPGGSVQVGQTLISGVISFQSAPPQYVHAGGDVFARTWYEKTVSYPNAKEIKVPSQNSTKKNRLKIFGTTINFYINSSIPYTNYDKITTEKEFSVGNYFLGISWESDIYTQYDVATESVSLEQSLARADTELEALIMSEVTPNSQIAAKSQTHSVAEDGTVSVTLTMEFIEQIGVKRKIDTVWEPPAQPAPAASPTPAP